MCIVTLSLRRAVFQIFEIKKCRDLEIRVRSHLRSLKVIQFDRLVMVSYYCPVVTLSDFKNTATLKSGSEVIQGHRNWYHSTDWLWLCFITLHHSSLFWFKIILRVLGLSPPKVIKRVLQELKHTSHLFPLSFFFS